MIAQLRIFRAIRIHAPDSCAVIGVVDDRVPKGCTCPGHIQAIILLITLIHKIPVIGAYLHSILRRGAVPSIIVKTSFHARFGCQVHIHLLFYLILIIHKQCGVMSLRSSCISDVLYFVADGAILAPDVSDHKVWLPGRAIISAPTPHAIIVPAGRGVTDILIP